MCVVPFGKFPAMYGNPVWRHDNSLGTNVESSQFWDMFCIINEVRMVQRGYLRWPKRTKSVCLTDFTVGILKKQMGDRR